MDQFLERYKSYENVKLLKIIENSEAYHPDAMKAAKKILAQRQISELELKEAKEEIELEHHQFKLKREKVKQVENKAKELGTEFIENINPIQQKPLTTNKTINIIVIVFAIISIVQIYREFAFFKFMLTDELAEWDLSMVGYFFQPIWIPITTILFWRKTKIGWFFLSVFLIYATINKAYLFFYTINLEETGYTFIDEIFPRTSPITYLSLTIIYGGTLWVICQENLRIIYKINKNEMWITIVFISIIVSRILFSI